VTTTHPKPIILASGSPRRRQLLGLLRLTFDVTSADIDETPRPGETARDYTARLSREKAQAIYARMRGQNALLLAADTTVADGDTILGKPADDDEARAMLYQLRGRTHQVYTALTLLDTATRRTMTDVALTNVHMRDYGDDEIDDYVASGDPFDKAGGYAIQNSAFHPVAALLRGFGVALEPDAPGLCAHPYDDGCDIDPALLNGSANRD